MKKPQNLSEFKISAAVVVFLTTAVFLSSFPARACEADYPIWQVRSRNADPLYRFIRNGKAGYIDGTGKIVVAPTLRYYGNSGDEFFDGLLLTGVGDGPYIDRTGRVALRTGYYRNWEFSEGLAAAVAEDNGRWGYIDKTGKFVISPRFEWSLQNSVYSFSDGLAMIEVGERYGYIDRTGEFVIEPRFLRGDDFSEGFARVVVDGPCLYVGDREPCDLFNGRIVGGTGGEKQAPACRFTFVDKSGAFLTDERFDRVGSFSEGLAAVEKDGKWGFIDRKGKMAIAPRFDRTGMLDVPPRFSEGLASVKKGDFWGYIDKTGNFAIAPRFAAAGDFHDGRAVVEEARGGGGDDEAYYYIDPRGAPAFPGKFAAASPFFKGVAHVRLIDPKRPKDDYYMNGKFAYIDVDGRKIFTYEVSSDDD
ncbi:MAG: WG repeat-containing protein [Acidobacteria bacterium]|nr:WG repeat-containing protein [Acidobacteriota bacterium]